MWAPLENCFTGNDTLTITTSLDHQKTRVFGLRVWWNPRDCRSIFV